MSDNKAKLHQVWFPLHHRPHWESLKHSPNVPTVFKGPLSKGRGGEGEGMQKKREKGKEGRKEGQGKKVEFSASLIPL